MSRSWLELEQIPITSLADTNPLLQSRFWARFKERFGWSASAFRLEDSSTMLGLVRRVAGGFRVCYIPHGPVSDSVELDAVRLVSVADGLARHYSSHGGLDLLRFDLAERTADCDGIPVEPAEPFRKAVTDIQPADTVVIDVTHSEDELLGAMKSKTRYNIGLSSRRGVEVVREGAGGLDRWYEMYRITAQRDSIAIHSLEYYRAIFELSLDDPAVNVDLLTAKVGDDAVAGNIVVGCGGVGTYLYGASSNAHRNLMPTYALQWEGIRLCKEWGCGSYDLGGIPPSDDSDHPMHGLYRMKTGFGGEIIHRLGSWDYPAKPLRYRVYRLGETARNYYYKRFRKRR